MTLFDLNGHALYIHRRSLYINKASQAMNIEFNFKYITSKAKHSIFICIFIDIRCTVSARVRQVYVRQVQCLYDKYNVLHVNVLTSKIIINAQF